MIAVFITARSCGTNAAEIKQLNKGRNANMKRQTAFEKACSEYAESLLTSVPKRNVSIDYLDRLTRKTLAIRMQELRYAMSLRYAKSRR